MRLSLCALLIGLLLPACAPAPPPVALPPLSPDVARTVRYIDDGLKYVDPVNAFFVAPLAAMCFRGVSVAGAVYPIDRWNFWCIDAHMVASVDALANDISYVPQVRLWCKHAYPYCARRIGGRVYAAFGTGNLANSITVQVVPAMPEKAAIEHLVRLLGGRLDPSGPLD